MELKHEQLVYEKQVSCFYAKKESAVYKIDKVALVNCEIFEKYLEAFRIAQGTEENRGRTKRQGLISWHTKVIMWMWRDKNTKLMDGYMQQMS